MMRYIDSMPLEVLHSSQHKWIRALITMHADWTPCSICEEIYGRRKQPYGRYHCINDCFLAISKWCQNEVHHSRLNPGYFNSLHKISKEWLDDVENFIWWMDLEIERIDEEELEKMKLRW